MARTQFTFTFTNAQPGTDVEFSAPVYADATTTKADGPKLALDSTSSVAIWSDATHLTATTLDGLGLPIAGTATTGVATVTVDDGTAGVSPLQDLTVRNLTVGTGTPAVGTLIAADDLFHAGDAAGFFGHAVHVQPAAIVNATNATDVITQLNLVLAALRNLGLIAT